MGNGLRVYWLLKQITLGMSAQAQGFFAGLISQGLPSLFSLLLTPKRVGNAEMTLGGFDSSKFIGTSYPESTHDCLSNLMHSGKGT